MAADSWHQPDSMEPKLYTMRKESNTERELSEQYVYEYLQNDTENVSINMLNDDCLKHIFLFLPIVDRVRIERVCERWRYLSQDSWHMVKALDLSSNTWGFKRPYAQVSPDVRHKILFKYGKFLTRIHINDVNYVNYVSLSTFTIIGWCCPNLTTIDITAHQICTSGIRTLANFYKNITKFKFGPPNDNYDNDLKYFFMLNQNLEYVAINKNHTSGEWLLCLPEQTMHTIIFDSCRCLQIKYLARALKKLENLKHLAIKQCGIATHIFKVIGQHCKNLKTLELDGDFRAAQTADMLYLDHLVNLQVLKITNNRNVSDDFLIDLVQRCQQLSTIDITGCSNVSDVGLTAIATLIRLEKLIVSYMDQITDDGLKNVRGLKKLECRGCLFSDRGMITLIKSSPQLQLLDLSRCKHITDTTLDVAKDICSSRTNNVMLKMIVGGTAILTKKEIDQEKLPPLLHIVNIDLSDSIFGVLRRDVTIEHMEMYLMDRYI